MSADALRESLRGVGIACEVEVRGALAVLRADEATAAGLARAELRERALAVAAAHGFTHAAIELRD